MFLDKINNFEMFNGIRKNLNIDLQKYLTGVVKDTAFVTIKLSGGYTELILDLIKKNGKSFILKKEISEIKNPTFYSAVVWLGFPLIISINERELMAGNVPIDVISTVIIPRMFVSRFESMLRVPKKLDTLIPISLLHAWGTEKITEFSIYTDPPLLDDLVYKDIEIGIQRATDKKENIGIILHGAPGNGKTTLAKWIACKFQIPIYVVSFTIDMDNHQIIRMFSNIKEQSIILFEDFDSYFDKKNPKLQDQKFSFDTILNVIDGIFTPPGPLIFIMTANNIEMIDDSLKARPSRFRFVREIGMPTENIRKKIFKDFDNVNELVNMTNGKSLDQVLDILDREINKKKE